MPALSDKIRGQSAEEAAKILFKTALDLSKFDQVNKNMVSKKGIFGNRIPAAEYKTRVVEVIKAFMTLTPPTFAKEISNSIQRNRNALEVLQKLKEVSQQLEGHCTIIPNPGDTVNVVLFDLETKFSRMTAVFTGSGIEDVFCVDGYDRQCEQIERLLRGEEGHDKIVIEEGQEEIKQLSELLHSLEKDGRLCADPSNAAQSAEFGTLEEGSTYQKTLPTARRMPSNAGTIVGSAKF